MRRSREPAVSFFKLRSDFIEHIIPAWYRSHISRHLIADFTFILAFPEGTADAQLIDNANCCAGAVFSMNN